MNEIEERILSTPRTHPPTPSNPALVAVGSLRELDWLVEVVDTAAVEAEYVRPSWREVNIDLLAQRLYAAHTKSLWGYEFDLHAESNESAAGWLAAAEAAVEMIIDEPEKEFQQSLNAVLNQPVTESQAAREWREASAGDWLA